MSGPPGQTTIGEFGQRCLAMHKHMIRKLLTDQAEDFVHTFCTLAVNIQYSCL